MFFTPSWRFWGFHGSEELPIAFLIAQNYCDKLSFFLLSENIFILPSFLKDVFTESRILGLQLFFLQNFMLFYCFPVCGWWEVNWYLNHCFPVYNVFSRFLPYLWFRQFNSDVFSHVITCIHSCWGSWSFLNL